MLIDFKGFKEPLQGDVSISNGKGKVLEYSSVACRWLETTIESIIEPGYYKLDERHFRLIKPSYSDLKEWLRVYFNELEAHAEYQSEEEEAYQSIISCCIGDGSESDLQEEIENLIFETSNEVKLKIYQDVLETIEEIKQDE